jgi:hypothetical protein
MVCARVWLHMVHNMRSLLRYEQLQLMAQRLFDQFCHDDPLYRPRSEDIPSTLSLILDVGYNEAAYNIFDHIPFYILRLPDI